MDSRLNEPGEMIDAIQAWINQVREKQSSDSAAASAGAAILLREVVELIRQGTPLASSETGFSETYADLERQVLLQTEQLNQATDALKAQIEERESSALKLRKAYNDLELYLQEHLADRTRLNQRLQDQIAEYQRLKALEQEERALTEALRTTLATMSSTLDLNRILDHILDTIRQVTPYDGANVLLLESDLVHVVRQRGYVTEDLENGRAEQAIPLSALAILQQLIELGKPLAIPDTAASPMWIGFPDLGWVSSNVIAPIRSDSRILGFLSLDSATPGFFTQTDADRLQVFADQVAIAIQNARLLERAKQSAVTAERSRLASEMHDTISQTLWSMSLITERLPAIWGIDPEQGERNLNILHQLVQNALVEMRSLLLELHPASLTRVGLGDLIRQTAEIIRNRTELDISVEIGEQEPVPKDVQLAVYRVVQEALNNIVRHASATHVDIFFSSHLGHIDLSIQDNGSGFDQARVGPDRLGISIMEDRVQEIGGALEIQSSGEQGTLVKLSWQAPTD